MSDELDVWREASDAASKNAVKWKPAAKERAAAVIRSYGDQRDADAYERGKLEGARLAIEAISLIVHDQDRETVEALSPAKIVGQG